MGMHFGGHVMVPDLGYKKDTWSCHWSATSFFDIPNTIPTTSTPMAPNCCITDKSCKSLPFSTTPLPTSSNGSVAWIDKFAQGGSVNAHHFMTPRGETISSPPHNCLHFPDGSHYPQYDRTSEMKTFTGTWLMFILQIQCDILMDENGRFYYKYQDTRLNNNDNLGSSHHYHASLGREEG